jgi:nucleoside-diphosphate-sugar epimerase
MKAFVTGGSGFIGGRLIERLVADGNPVRALARSDAAAGRIAALGAESVRGDLADGSSLEDGARGCEVAFHAAAKVEDWGRWEDFHRDNVRGAHNVATACAAAGIRRLVHVSTEAVLIAGRPLVRVDETAPRRPDSKAFYPRSKALAEEIVLREGGPGLEVVVLRPRFVWGAGDPTLLPQIAAMVRAGRFAWIGGGRHLTDTTHVDNVVHGLLLAAERGSDREVYFVTDGEPVSFRAFVSELIRTQALDPPTRSVPAPVAAGLAAAAEDAWRLLPLPGRPPITRFTVWCPRRSARSTSRRPAASSATSRCEVAPRASRSFATRRASNAARAARVGGGRAGSEDGQGRRSHQGEEDEAQGVRPRARKAPG